MEKTKTTEKRQKSLRLSCTERFVINQFLPNEGSLLEQMTARDILQKTKVFAAERQKVKYFQNPGGQVEIDSDTDFETEFEFDKAEIEMLKSGFKKLDDERRINQKNVGLAIKLRDL